MLYIVEKRDASGRLIEGTKNRYQATAQELSDQYTECHPNEPDPVDDFPKVEEWLKMQGWHIRVRTW